jgi:2-phospho-L-lactate guanylyltransferase
MMTTAVLVPFKGDRYKSRLAPVLDAEQRKQFAYLLLESVLGAIAEAGLRRDSCVISPDPEAWARASRAGVSYLRERADAGVNAAVRRGMRRLANRDSFMVLPSDLALLTAPDIKHAMRMGRDASLVIAPSSSFNGTNLLMFPRRFGRFLSYDDNSFWNHLDAAAGLGLRTTVVTRKALVFDVDTPQDAAEFADLHANTRAGRFLGRLRSA